MSPWDKSCFHGNRAAWVRGGCGPERALSFREGCSKAGGGVLKAGCGQRQLRAPRRSAGEAGPHLAPQSPPAAPLPPPPWPALAPSRPAGGHTRPSGAAAERWRWGCNSPAENEGNEAPTSGEHQAAVGRYLRPKNFPGPSGLLHRLRVLRAS